jgi:putative Mg2+ transporter-C (MgtC) family protein
MIANPELVLRLLIAAVLGSLIGLERERLLWAAGLRTHMLGGVGSAQGMLVSAYGSNAGLGPHVTLDPSRVAAQVVSGIGFLGAGTIIFRREVIRGLTTAASLWSVAAIGLASGAGLYVAAVSATVLILVILAGLKPLELRWRRHMQPAMELHVLIGRNDVPLASVVAAAAPVILKQIRVDRGRGQDEDHVRAALPILSRLAALEVVDQLRSLKGVRSVWLETEGEEAGEG